MKKNLVSAVCATSIVIGSVVAAQPASAATHKANDSFAGPEVSRETIEAAMPELRAAGVVTAQRKTTSGDLTSTFDLGHGLEFDMVVHAGESSERISGGKDSHGVWIQLNTIDQNLILSGGAWMMSAGICAAFGLASGGTACVIVGAVTTAATVAISTNGGTCANAKQLRVWVNGSSKPKCV